MSERDFEKLEKLDPELRKLLDSESTYSDMPSDAPAKLFAKVSAAIHLPSGGGGGGGSGGGHGAGGGAGTDSPADGAKAVAHLPHAAWSAAKTATLIAFSAGTAVGVAGHATYERLTTDSAPRTEASVAIAPPIVDSVLPKPESAPSAVVNLNEPLPTTQPVMPSIIVPKNDDRGDDRDLADERAQLEVARTALARGQADAALTTLRSDATKHPKSRLAEERDSLLIQALALTGRNDEANARIAAFKRKYPKSLFLPVIDAVAAEARDK